MVQSVYDARRYPRGDVRAPGMDKIMDMLVAAKGEQVTIEDIREEFRKLPELMVSTRSPTKPGIPQGSMEEYIPKYVGFAVNWIAAEIVVFKYENARQKTAAYALKNWHQFEEQVFTNGVRRYRLKKPVHDRLVAQTDAKRKLAAQQKLLAPPLSPAEQETVMVSPTPEEMTEAAEANSVLQSDMMPETDDANEQNEAQTEDGSEGIIQEPEAAVEALTAPRDANDSSDGAEIALPAAITTGKRKQRRAA